MKRPPVPARLRFLSVALLLFLPLASLAAAGPVLRQRSNFDADWLFHQGDPNGVASSSLDYAKIKDAVIASSAGFLNGGAVAVPAALGHDVACTQPAFDDQAWEHLNLPHDWAIAGPFEQSLPGDTGKLRWQGTGWYRKHFTLPASPAKDRRTFLDIDGAMAYATVWCNGQFVGGWPYGYASFRLDLTPCLKTDGSENVLAIRLNNPPDSSRWYPGSGLYRHVWLVQTSPVHVAPWGVAVKTPDVTPDQATVQVNVTTDYEAGASGTTIVPDVAIFEADAQGHPVGSPVARMASKPPFALPAHGAAGRTSVDGTATLSHPKLWDLQHPNLYVAVTTVLQNGQPVDREETVFGVRTVQFTSNRGFLLNGQRVPLQGVCDHHDLGALGAALNDSALRRQISLLKGMGCNAIRTSHNPPSPELLDLCDRLGMLVMDESFDCWRSGKRSNDYHVLWTDWHEKDQRALVRRDRNHPSVILWSIGNEIPDQGSPDGPAIAAELTRIVHQEDGGDKLSRRTTSACDRTESGFNEFHKGLDVMGFNYKPNDYNRFHQANPQQPVIGTETSSCISTRGFYTFPLNTDKAGGQADFQVSDYDLSAPPWATTPDAEFKGQDDAPFTGGEFVWTGFDYLGEPTPYNADTTNLLNFQDPVEKAKMAEQLKALGKMQVPSRSSYFGIIDLAGFPKNRYYEYQARWRPSLPMAHILPDWTWPDRVGQVTPVHVFTSGDEAELFLNGQSLGRKKKGPREYRLRWDNVKYAPGELKVVAYKDGNQWATDTVRTAGAPARIALRAEAPAVLADGKDLAFVEATVTDQSGGPVPRAGNTLKFSVTGPAEIVATNNGDATSHAPFGSPACEAFNGKCLVILRPKAGVPGLVTIHAASDGLQAADATVQCR